MFDICLFQTLSRSTHLPLDTTRYDCTLLWFNMLVCLLTACCFIFWMHSFCVLCLTRNWKYLYEIKCVFLLFCVWCSLYVPELAFYVKNFKNTLALDKTKFFPIYCKYGTFLYLFLHFSHAFLYRISQKIFSHFILDKSK